MERVAVQCCEGKGCQPGDLLPTLGPVLAGIFTTDLDRQRQKACFSSVHLSQSSKLLCWRTESGFGKVLAAWNGGSTFIGSDDKEE